jgi:hypothetical protein
MSLTTPVSADEPKETVTVIKLSVQAQAAPKPALKYLLLPELKDMQPGNPITAYYRCFMEQHNFYRGKEAAADREKWLNCPLSELPDNLADYGGSSTRQADYAARLDTCDWQILHKIRKDGIGLLLPDIQPLRELASVLKVRYRGQIKVGKFDDAIRTHQTMFALARHLGEHPTIISNLVGIAIAHVAIGPFEELIQQPGSPNLYWAIAQLPKPFVNLRRGFEGERVFFLNEGEWGTLIDSNRVWSEDDVRTAREAARKFKGIFDFNRKGDDDIVEKWLLERVKDEAWLSEARKRLVTAGMNDAKVKKFPPEQVLFFDLRAKLEIARDDVMKWAALPFWQADAEMSNLAKRPEDPTPEQLIMHSLVPAIHKIHRAQGRIDQRLALLQVVEALRLHAAANEGKLPVSLSDVKVPLPVDPITGKPFIYKLDAATAILQGTPPKGDEKNPVMNIRYEVTIRK